MAWKEHEMQRLYWDIGEVAEMFGIATSKIRFYEQEFKLIVKKNRIGERKFTAQDIERMRLIVSLCDRFKMWYVRYLLREGLTERVYSDLLELEGKTQVVNG